MKGRIEAEIAEGIDEVREPLVTAFAGTLYLFLRKHNCHVNGCWRMEWHPHPDHGHPVCKKHHPEGHKVTA